MPNLPTQDQSGDVTATVPVDRVSARSYALKGSYLQQGLETLSAGLNDLNQPLGEMAGQQAAQATTVTKDASGNTVVQSPMEMPILGPGGTAYAHALAAGSLAKSDNAVSTDITNLRVQNPTAQGFQTATDSYIKNLQANNPGPIGQGMVARATDLAGQHYDNLVTTEAQNHVADAKNEISTAMTTKLNSLYALATGGQNWTASPEYADYMSLSKQLSSNPTFGVDPKIQASSDSAVHDQLTAASVAGEVDRTWNGPGGPDAARKSAYASINDPSLDLSPAQRKSAEGAVAARIQFNVGNNAAAAAANREDVNALRQMATDPSRMSTLSEPNWSAAIVKATKLGDSATVQQLVNSQLVWRQQMQTRGVAPNQASINQGVPAPGTPAPGTTPAVSGAPVSTPQGLAAYKGRVAQIENASGDPNATSSAGATGKYQFEPSTWAKYGAGADIHGDQEAAMNGLTSDNRNALAAQLGREPTQAELYLAHQQGAQGALKLMAEPSRRAGDIVGDQAVNGNGGNSSMTAGDFVNMWKAKFDKTPIPPSTGVGGVPFTPKQLNDNPGLLSTWAASTASDRDTRYKYAEAIGTSMEHSINAGMMPPVNVAAGYAQIAQDEPRLAEQAHRIGVGVQGAQLADSAINLPPGQGAAYQEHVMEVARSSPDMFHQEVALAMQSALAKKTEALKKDPFATAVAEGWDGGKGAPDPLNFADVNALAVGLHQRSDLVGSITARTGDQNMGALAPSEVESVKSQLDGPNAMNVASALSTLPEQRRNATFAQIGEKGAGGQLLAIAGSLYPSAPDVANDIVTGRQAMREKGDYAPKPLDANTEMDKYMPNATFGVVAREGLMNAVTAVYAKASADARDTSGTMNSTRFREAVDRVTGGVLNFHNGALIAPTRGMSQGDFDNVVAHVGDDDLRGATTLGGQPVTGDVFQNSAKLENAGDGKYFVRLDNNAAKPVYAYSQGQNGQPTKFVLDLRGRAPTPGYAPVPPFMNVSP
jgi:hypothetical protein